jgi:hypothetical protein
VEPFGASVGPKMMVAVALVSIVGVGCSSELPIEHADSVTRREVSHPSSDWSDVRPYEVEFASLSAAIPSFAGFFLDSTGTLRVLTTDRNTGRELVRRITPLVERQMEASRLAGGRGQIVVSDARFTFAQLSAWRNIASKMMLN